MMCLRPEHCRCKSMAASKVVVRSSRRRRHRCQCVSVWWCLLLVVTWFFQCVDGQIVHANLQFNVTEEQPIGFVVGRLPVRPGLQYRFSGNPPAEFQLDRVTGVITSQARLDREAIPPRSGGARMVDAIIQSVPAPPAQLFDVRISVLDINDNRPTFPRSTVRVTFVETDLPGTRVILETAVDPDNGPNGTVSNYRIVAGDEKGRFRLSVASSGSGVARLLYLENVVELQNGPSSYALNISCEDGGSPPLYGYLLVNVNVTDVNNHAPVFDHETYHATINETVAVGTTVLRVRATDADSGDNAAVVYSIIAGDDRRQFAVDQTSGTLTTARRPLTCPAACSPAGTDLLRPCRSKRCKLTLKAADRGQPHPLSAFASVHVEIADVNDHAPVIRFRNQEPGRPLVVDESVSEGDILEAVSVTDDDDGPNGETTARLVAGNKEGSFAFIPSTIPELYLVLVAAASRRLQYGRCYNLTLEARDAGSPPRITHASLIILVGRVDVSPPVFEPASYVASVSESAPIGSFVAAVLATSSSASPVTYQILSDDDNDNLNWFTVNSETGLVTTNASMDWTQRSSYNLTVQATAGMLSASADLLVSVLPSYRTPPVFSRSRYRVVLSHANTTSGSLVMVVAASIENRSGARYGLSDEVEDDYPDTFQIGRTSGRIVTIRSLGAGMIYKLTVIAVNPLDPASLSSQVSVIVNVTNVQNLPPVVYPVRYFVKIVGNQRIGSVVTTVRSFNISDSVIFSISSGADSSKFDIDQSLGTVSTAAILTPATIYTVTVVARDKLSGLSSVRPATVKIYVMSSSSTVPPITFSQPLGYSFDITEDDGRRSTAVVGRSVGRVTASSQSQLMFYLADGDPDDVFSVSSSTGVITTTRPVDRERRDRYNLTLVATSDVDFATIHVFVVVADINDHAPRFRGGDEVDVDVSADSPVGFEVYAARAVDPDAGRGGTVRYRLTNSSDSLSLDAATGLLRVTSFLPADTLLSVIVVAVDGGVPALSSTQTVRVHVGTVLDSSVPLFNTSMLWTSVSESTPINSRFYHVNTSRSLSASATVSYSISRHHGFDDGRLRIFPDGWLYNAGALDRERRPEYVLTVTATEHGVTRTRRWSVEVVIVVFDNNDHSPAFDRASYSFTVVEGSPAADFAELVYATDADAGRNADLIYWIEGSTFGFRIDPLYGLLTTQRSFDREQLIADTGTDVITLVVIAADTGVVSRQSRVIVDITVSDINDNAPTFDLSLYLAFTPENATVNSTVVVVTARDPDAGLNGTVLYHIRDDGEQFAVEESTGRVLLMKPLDVNRLESYELVVVASDRGTPPLTSTTSVRVSVVRTMPRPPRWTHMPRGSVEVGADAAVGTLIGSVKAAADQTPGSSRGSRVTYSIMSSVGVPFIVEASTGRLFVSAALDSTRRRKYALTVVARDESSSLTSSTPLSVEVLPDITDRSPRFTDDAGFRYRVEADAPAGTTVFRATATDLDGAVGARMRYWLSRQIPDGRQFSVDADSGMVTVASALNVRDTASSYRLTLAVVDDSLTASYRLTSQRTFTVDVVDGTPEFLSPAAVVLPSDARPGTLVSVVTAVAVGNYAVRYSLPSDKSSSDAGIFRIDGATGRLYLTASLTAGRAVYSAVVMATDSRIPARSSLRSLTVITQESASSVSADGGLVFSSSAYSGRVAENLPVFTPVVSVSASRAGRSSRVQYYITSITSPDSALPLPLYFDVLPTSGLVRTARVLDREMGLGTFVLQLCAVDTSPDLTRPRTRNVTVSTIILYI